MSIFEVNDLKKYYQIQSPFKEKKIIKALDGVSFSLEYKKTLGLVGESGCGKSTLAKTLLQLEDVTSGNISFEDKNIDDIKSKYYRSSVQMIFQDPYNSLNPRKQAWELISTPLLINTKLSKQERFNMATEMMEQVGLRKNLAHRYPHMFSGGQRQRLGIARALILKPKIIICDEPVSALDVSIQAQVLNLMIELQNKMNLTYLFISHDLSVVKHISDFIMVMYLGKIVEYGDSHQIFNNPKHPYTKALLSSAPAVKQNDQERIQLKGEIPSPLSPPKGCSFHTRCPIATEECEQIDPTLKSISGVKVACLKVE